MVNAAARRLPLFAAAAICLIAGVAAGEGRLGWPGPTAELMAIHGPLMVAGFFGTVIGLERAVALGRPWGFAAPAASALGGLVLIVGQVEAGAIALTLASLIFLGMALNVIWRQREIFTAVLALGALAWVGGNAVWLAGWPLLSAVPLWAGFLVLTIAGERLELSRFLPPWRWRVPTLVPVLALLVAGAGLGPGESPLAWRLFGAGLVALTLWSVRNDVIRRTIRQPGLTRYVAVALLSGYVWAAVAGVLMAVTAPGDGGPLTDAALHALFIGFVFAMVFGHAPVILPALLRVAVPHRGYFYLPLALLHASLILRLAGDLADHHDWRQWGGLTNAVAIAVFIIVMAATVVIARRK